MIMIGPLFAAILAQSTATEPQREWAGEVGASTTIGAFHQGSEAGGLSASGQADATWYLRRPLVDDGTPLSLQAYLQRLNRLSLSLGGGGSWGHSNATQVDDHQRSLAGTLAWRVY